MAEEADAVIVAELVDVGALAECEADVWRHKVGLLHAEGFALCRTYGVGDRTLRRWAANVRLVLAAEKVYRREGGVRFGHSLASGARVRWAPDGTPLGHVPGSAWNPDRIEAAIGGTQRQNEKLPPKLKRGK